MASIISLLDHIIGILWHELGPVLDTLFVPLRWILLGYCTYLYFCKGTGPIYYTAWILYNLIFILCTTTIFMLKNSQYLLIILNIDLSRYLKPLIAKIEEWAKDNAKVRTAYFDKNTSYIQLFFISAIYFYLFWEWHINIVVILLTCIFCILAFILVNLFLIYLLIMFIIAVISSFF